MNNLLNMAGSLQDIVFSQFMLAQYGISIEESNQLCLFEFDAYLNLTLRREKQKHEQAAAEAEAFT